MINKLKVLTVIYSDFMKHTLSQCEIGASQRVLAKLNALNALKVLTVI